MVVELAASLSRDPLGSAGKDEMDRIIELAIEALEKRRIAIDTEIEELRSQLRDRVPTETAMKAVAEIAAGAPRRGRRTRTAAEKKAQSERMKAYWTNRKARETRAAAAKKSAAMEYVRGPKSAAARKALSEKMKQVWAKRKAEAAKKSK
jgi:hypothetical protein